MASSSNSWVSSFQGNLASPTLLATVWPNTTSQISVRSILLVLFGSLLLTASAKVSVPFYPVPMTMQTAAVLLIGMAFGWRLGVATVLAYLAQGVAGLPVFSGNPAFTGGYLLGFLFAAAAVGFLAEKGWDRSPIRTFAAMLLGNLMIYVPGLIWLGAAIGWDKPIIEMGMTPFLLGDLTKALFAAALLPGTWWLIRRQSSSDSK